MLVAVESKVEELATRSEKEIFELHSQTSNLQTRNSELEVEVKRLQNENAELKRIVVVQTSEMETVVQARDDALKKLRRVRRVARDLMDEKKVSFEFNGGVDLRGHIQGWTQLESPLIRRRASGSMSESQENSSAAEEFYDATSRRSLSTSSSSSSRPASSGSDRTARPIADKEPAVPPAAPVAQSNDTTRQSPQKASTACAELIRAKWNSKSEPLIPKSAPVTKPVSRTVPSTRATSPVPGAGNNKASVPESNVPTRPASPVQPTVSTALTRNSSSRSMRQPNILRVQISPGQKWKLNTNKPPHLPMIKEALRSVEDPYHLVGLYEDECEAIERLAHEPTGLRIHFLWEKSCAFMIDPLFFEMLAPAPIESYLVDWAPKTTTSNGRIRKAVTRHTKDDDTSPALHVFSYVSNQGEGVWYYLGAHSFHVAKFVQPLWETLAEASQALVIEQIQARIESVDDDGTKARLASGEWPAFCLKMENNNEEHAEMTYSMVQRLEKLKELEDAE
ncbi:hypothetical protein CCMSSC00406_0001009 [Pleurotus cornucopiae]|uniref:Uncharacterized protein n=1 Tax=Pleurotus cornucopiae TaxID=5321 RepID=A0ACB7IKX6_PLECO|nr:hypothetical protein CCMSSC00406_0001009 [Pleurotus cornucopiae]